MIGGLGLLGLGGRLPVGLNEQPAHLVEALEAAGIAGSHRLCKGLCSSAFKRLDQVARRALTQRARNTPDGICDEPAALRVQDKRDAGLPRQQLLESELKVRDGSVLSP